MADPKLCRYCGREVKPTTKDGKPALRHAAQDNGDCEVRRRIITGDSKTPIEAA